MTSINVIRNIFNNKNIFYIDKKYREILENILILNYKVIQEFKNDKRTYVAKILVNDEYYLLKRIYTRKRIKQFFSIFKKGEALSTLINVNEAIIKGVKELAEPLGAVIERKKGMINNEILIMKYYDGRRVDNDKELFQAMQVLDKIYSLNRFHGDCNPANIYIKDGKIILLDTKLKKMMFGDYRKHYDILTLMKYIKEKINYPYKKNIFYYLAWLTRKLRDKKRGRK